MIIKGHLKMVILKLLSEKTGKTGAQLVEEIDKILGSKPSYGSIYPSLQGLEEKNLVRKEKMGKEKRYRLTEKGKKAEEEFEEKKQELEDSVLQALKTFRTIFEDDEVNTLIKSFEKKRREKEGPRLPELLQIHELLLKTSSEEKVEKVRKILTRTIEDLTNLLED